MGPDRDVESLPERERAVLRLLLRGHDAKSIARALHLSIHVVNERLRDSRRRLGVSSSREAARLLAGHEGAEPVGNKEFGLAGSQSRRRLDRAGDERKPSRLLMIGAAMIFIAIAVLALTPHRPEAAAVPASPAPPHVVATSPAAGAVIAPGPFMLSVTFDQPMRDGNYSFVQTSAETYPDCPGQPMLSRDSRTYTLRCTAAPGRRYEIWFNRPPYMNFRGESGVSAEPHRLTFRTHG